MERRIFLIFSQKKYAQEVENQRKKNARNHKKEQEDSFGKMVAIGLLITFPLTRWILRIHKRKIIDHSTTQTPLPSKQIPIIYIHGFRGGDYTTNVMVHETCKLKRNDKYLKVTVNAFGNVKLEGTWTNDQKPLVQLILEPKILGIPGISYLLRVALKFLKKRYGFTQYDAVSHSLGAPCVVKTEMKTSSNKNYPRLHKCALIAGPFDGVMYLGDIPNVNRLNERGRPQLMNPSYIGMLLRRRKFNPNISVLNIYGNTLDETNTDRFVSVVSAKSIRYILAPVVTFFREVEIRGSEMAEHSMLHDNKMVISIINKFLNVKSDQN